MSSHALVPVADSALVLAAAGGGGAAGPKTALTPEELERKLEHVNATNPTVFVSNTGSTAGQGSGAHALYNKHRRKEAERVRRMEGEARCGQARTRASAAELPERSVESSRLPAADTRAPARLCVSREAVARAEWAQAQAQREAEDDARLAKNRKKRARKKMLAERAKRARGERKQLAEGAEGAKAAEKEAGAVRGEGGEGRDEPRAQPPALG